MVFRIPEPKKYLSIMHSAHPPSSTPPPLLNTHRCRKMLMAWMQSLITAARAGSVSLRVPIYNFLETTTYYPPELPAEGATAVAAPAAPASSSASRGAVQAQAMPMATAVPASSPSAPPSDGWSVPVWSRETSDMKLAMAGPDRDGFLVAGAVAEALRSGTGANTTDLRAIWELSDIDKDGKLDREEVGRLAPWGSFFHGGGGMFVSMGWRGIVVSCWRAYAVFVCLPRQLSEIAVYSRRAECSSIVGVGHVN